MKKRKYLSIVILTSALNFQAMSAEDASFNESKTINNKDFNNLTIRGLSDLDTITAHTLTLQGQAKANRITAKKVIVNGPISLTNSKLDSLDVKGPAEIAGSIIADAAVIHGPALTFSSKFRGVVTINGSLESVGSAFEKLLTVSGQENKFQEVAAKKIKLLKPKYTAKTSQVVVLKASHVDVIEFDAGNGIVRADKKSTVGKVSGGTLSRD